MSDRATREGASQDPYEGMSLKELEQEHDRATKELLRATARELELSLRVSGHAPPIALKKELIQRIQKYKDLIEEEQKNLGEVSGDWREQRQAQILDTIARYQRIVQDLEAAVAKEKAIPVSMSPKGQVVTPSGKTLVEWDVRVGDWAEAPKLLASPPAKRVLVTGLGSDKKPREAYCVGLVRDERDDLVATVWYGFYFAGLPLLEVVHATRILPVDEEP